MLPYSLNPESVLSGALLHMAVKAYGLVVVRFIVVCVAVDVINLRCCCCKPLRIAWPAQRFSAQLCQSDLAPGSAAGSVCPARSGLCLYLFAWVSGG